MSAYEKVGVHRPPPVSDSEDSDVDAASEGELPRTSTEQRDHDRHILETEEEVEKLLVGEKQGRSVPRLFGRKDEAGNEVQISNGARRQHKREARREARRDRREARREHRRGKIGEGSELMYEMEEGHRNSGESSGSSSEVDRKTWEEVQQSQRVGELLSLCGNEVLSSHSL